MKTQWFLGANSGVGFYSLYDNFPGGEGDFLRVIKGGPGTGKSGFMERLGAAAEKAGLDVEYIRCSGDPDSLDGLYLPQKHLAWADGTAPHTLEPELFGVSGAYLDLGRHCDVSVLRERAGEIREATAKYKARYARAYSLLRSAAELGREACVPAEREAAAGRALSMAARELPREKKNVRPGKVVRRFISGLTCRGPVFFEDTLRALCGRVALLDDRFGLAGPYLETILREATARGVDAVLCPDPLTPSVPEAVLLPSLSLGFLAARKGREPEPWRHIRLDAIADPARIRERRPHIRQAERLRAALLSEAAGELAEAKALHDGLEALYRPCVDFSALTAAAGEEIARVIER